MCNCSKNQKPTVQECEVCSNSFDGTSCVSPIAYEDCTSCSTTTTTAIANCNRTDLIKNKCTLITEASVVKKTRCYTPREIIKTALFTLDPLQGCGNISDDYLLLYNMAITDINERFELLLEVKEAIVSRCGNCEFYAPPQFSKILSLTNEVQSCDKGCSNRRFEYLPSSVWAGSRLSDGQWTYFDKKIHIADPKECGCSEELPDLLKITYKNLISEAESIDEEVCVSPFIRNLIVNSLLAGPLSIKKNNQYAGSVARDQLREMEMTAGDYDTRNVQVERYTVFKKNRSIR